MNKKRFLSSSFGDVAGLLPMFEENLKGKTVTFIPTASVVEEVVFFVEVGRKALEALGLMVDTLEISTASADEIEMKIGRNDMIYVTGGNTFFLLKELRRTGADQRIIDAVNAGKPYIGESAGAIVAAPNIEYARLMDSSKKAHALNDFSGLGLVDFYTIPHYTNPPFIEAAQEIMTAYASKLNLKPISNHEAILVIGDDVTVSQSSL